MKREDIPAFPLEMVYTQENEKFNGMTLRDYFAAKALQGLLVDGVGSLSDEELASWAYKLAEAMMKEREQ